MEINQEALRKVPIFRGLAQKQLDAAAPLWSPKQLAAGELLWIQGHRVDEIAVATEGELKALVDDVEVGRIQAGELLGETSIFIAGATRSATIRARTPTHILRLKLSALSQLRADKSDLYELLLEQALVTLTRRIRATNVRIAQLTKGTEDAPSRAEPGFFARLWRRPSRKRDEMPDVLELLRRQPCLQAATESVIHEVATAFSPKWVESGDVIFLEGEAGDCGFLIGSGKVDVLRHVQGERAELLTSLKTGDLFGVNAIVETATRTASCVATESSWLFQMDRVGYNRLAGDALRLWRENLLVMFNAQLRNANRLLRQYSKLPSSTEIAPVPRTPSPTPQEAASKQQSDRPAPTKRASIKTTNPDARFNKLLKASGVLEGMSVSERELNDVRVVTSEDAKRYASSRLK